MMSLIVALVFLAVSIVGLVIVASYVFGKMQEESNSPIVVVRDYRTRKKPDNS